MIILKAANLRHISCLVGRKGDAGKRIEADRHFSVCTLGKLPYLAGVSRSPHYVVKIYEKEYGINI